MMNNEVKIPGPQTGITDVLDEILRQNDTTFESFPLRPSAAGKCSRALAHDLMAYKGLAEYPEEVKEPNVQRLLSLGHSIEYHVLGFFRKFTEANPNIKIGHKQQSVDIMQLPDGSWISGSIDFSIKWGDEFGLGDIKSKKDAHSVAYKTKWVEILENHADMKSLKQIGNTAFYAEDLGQFLDELNDPFFASNFYQLNTYCCTMWAKRHNVTFGSIVRYNKNTSEMYEVRFKPSEKVAEETKKKFLSVYQAVEKKDPELVPKDFVLGSASCAFCQYTKECWPNATKKDHYKDLPKKKWPRDTNRLSEGDELERLFVVYEQQLKSDAETKKIHEDIVKILERSGETKIRLDNGHIYELKSYKTGGVANGPRLALKRSKL